MKNLFIILVMLLSFNAIAQKDNDYVNTVIEIVAVELSIETDGDMFPGNKNETGYDTYGIILPEYYTKDLIKLSVNKFIKTYSDISNVTGWMLENEGFYKVISFVPDPNEDYQIRLMIGYVTEFHSLIITYY